MTQKFTFAAVAAVAAALTPGAWGQHNGMIYTVNQSDRYVEVSTFRDISMVTKMGNTCVPPGKTVGLKTLLNMVPDYFGNYGLRVDVRGLKSCSEPSFKAIRPQNTQYNWKIIIDKNYNVRVNSEVDVLH